MTYAEFPIEFHSEAGDIEDVLAIEAQERLIDLRGERTDMTGAAIAMDLPGQTGDNRPLEFSAQVVVYMRPNDAVAIKTDGTAEGPACIRSFPKPAQI